MNDNLFHWHVKMFNFERDSPLARDLAAYAQKFGQMEPHVLLELTFPGDYPFSPYVPGCCWCGAALPRR